MKVGIINTGLGNVASIKRMLERVGATGLYVSSKNECIKSEALILPGVGHFAEGMRALRDADLIETIKDRVSQHNIPILGICLGMQLLCRSSEEGSQLGLGLIDADVKKFNFEANQRLKIPHMGWNIVMARTPNPLISKEEERFYFVHSYRVVPDDCSIVIGTSDYGGKFCSAFQKNNIFGVQFHPEKSHSFGMNLMKNFINYK
jgi:glutamine amidotransferase